MVQNPHSTHSGEVKPIAMTAHLAVHYVQPKCCSQFGSKNQEKVRFQRLRHSYLLGKPSFLDTGNNLRLIIRDWHV